MASKINVDINYPELVKILGIDPNNPDDEKSINIRHMMIQTFTDKYLKSLINSTTIKESVATLTAFMRQSIKEQIGEIIKPTYWASDKSTEFIPSEQFKLALDDYIKSEREKLISSAVTEEFNSTRNNLKDKLDASTNELDKRLNTWIDQRTKSFDEFMATEFDEQIKAMIEQRAQELFKDYLNRMSSKSLKETLGG